MSLLACVEPAPVQAEPNACAALYQGGPGPTSEVEILGILEEVRALYPRMAGVVIEMRPNTSDSSYYAANLDLPTLFDDPLARTYVLEWSTLVLDDPPPWDATVAVLAHELAHLDDYLDMDGTELAEFGIWYATSDHSEYERATDLTAMELGCGSGLIDFRAWLYNHVDAETYAQKRIDYWTPEEIALWMSGL